VAGFFTANTAELEITWLACRLAVRSIPYGRCSGLPAFVKKVAAMEWQGWNYVR
jgi:hypothetical protein